MFQIGHVRDASSMPAPANRPSFVDDISDGADSWTGVVDLTDRILQRLTYFNISISALKSKFGKTVVDFLGHLISREGIHAKPRGFHQVLQMPFPKSLRAMQSFLGSINFYSRFIENYSIKASCLYEISDDQQRQGSVSSAALAAFDELKRAYASTPVLKHANPNLPFHVLLYVTNWAISATLCQEHDGLLHPVRFCVLESHRGSPRVLKGGEPRYEHWEREILALLHVLKVCFYELRSNSLTVYSKHAIINWIRKDKQGRTDHLSWAAMLSPWTLQVVDSSNLQGLDGIPMLLASSLCPPSDSTMDDLTLYTPLKSTRSLTPVQQSLPRFTAEESAVIATFDGFIKFSERVGGFGAILWQLLEWKILWAGYGVVTDTTVNGAEYAGLLAVLSAAIRLHLTGVRVFGDSRLVIQQVLNRMRCTKPHLQTLLAEVHTLNNQLANPSFHHVKRVWNGAADYLASQGLTDRTT
ncbi:hypothetical protein AeMF1_020769, partial [Aphanomyces euteiches]